MRIPEGKGAEKSLKKYDQKVLNLMENVNLHIQDTKQTLSRINSKSSTPRHPYSNCLKGKGEEKNLKASQRKTTHYKEISEGLSTDFSSETMKVIHPSL